MHYPFHIRDLFFFSFLCWIYTIVVYIVYPCRRCANSVCHWLKVGKHIQQIIIVCSSSTDRKLGCVIMFVLIRCCPYPFSTYQNSHPARITKSSSPLQCICLPTVLNKWKEGRICFWIEWKKKKNENVCSINSVTQLTKVVFHIKLLFWSQVNVSYKKGTATFEYDGAWYINPHLQRIARTWILILKFIYRDKEENNNNNNTNK